MGKGSKRRPREIDDETFSSNWNRVFKRRSRGDSVSVQGVEVRYKKTRKNGEGVSEKARINGD